MLNLDTFLPIFLVATRFATTYSEGTYGSGSYNEMDSSTSSPTTPAPTQTNSPNVTTTQVGETPTVAADQPAASSDEPPVTTTTTQPVIQQNTTTESDVAIGTDPMWIVIASAIAVGALIALFVIIVKKLTRR